MFALTKLVKKTTLVSSLVMWCFICLAVLASQSVQANASPVFDPIPAQQVYPDQVFVYPVTATDADGDIPSIRMLNAPEGASLTKTNDGAYEFKWQLPEELADDSVIIFQAVDAVDASLISTQRMVLRNGQLEQGGSEERLTESSISKSDVSESIVPASVVSEPSTARAEVTKPVVTEPSTARAGVAKPAVKESAVTMVAIAELGAAKESIVEPAVVDQKIEVAALAPSVTENSAPRLPDVAGQPLKTEQGYQLSNVLSGDSFKWFSLGALTKYAVFLILLAYVVFVFVAEDLNPFASTKLPSKRRRWRLGRAAAVASIVGGFCAIMLMQMLELSSALSAAWFLCITLILMLPSIVRYKKSVVWQ